MTKKNRETEDMHSEDLQEIISKPPSWLLKQGISLVLLTVLLLFALSAFIRYPEILRNEMKITTDSAPKAVINKVPGNLVKIRVAEGEDVVPGQVLGYMESTAAHEQVLALMDTLTAMRRQGGTDTNGLLRFTSATDLQLGELQGAYRDFHQAYLDYQSVKEGGLSLQRRKILEEEMENIAQQNERIGQAYALQVREVELAKAEFEKYRLLAEKKVISPMELQRQEALLLAKMQALPQSEAGILNNRAVSLARNRELAELDGRIGEEKKKFAQSMNSLISEAENWKQRHVLVAPSGGKVVYASVLQENQYLAASRDVFYIYAETGSYFGEMYLPQSAFGKIRAGQDVLIKVRGYPHEEYGYLRGKIERISDIPVRDSVFLSRVGIRREPKDATIRLKPGLLADADIITEDQTILYRIWKNVVKSLKRN